jgi:thymidylate synthase
MKEGKIYKKTSLHHISMKQYLDLVKHVMETVCQKETEQGQVQKCFGYQMRFDLSEGFPMVTTKNAPKIYLRITLVSKEIPLKIPSKENGVW